MPGGGPCPARGLRSHQASAQGHVLTVGLSLGLLPELLDTSQQVGQVSGAHGHPSHLAGACGDRGALPHGASQTTLLAESTTGGTLCTARLTGGGKLWATLWDLPQKESAPEPWRGDGQRGWEGRRTETRHPQCAQAVCRHREGSAGNGGLAPSRVRLDGVTPVDVQEWGIRKYPGALGQSRRLPICGCSEWAGGMKC